MIRISLCIALVLADLPLLSQTLADLSFGTDSTFEVMTWNVERFPKNGEATLEYVADIITALNVDLVALQEIDSKSRLEQLIESLEDWEGYYVDSKYSGLAFLYKPSVVEVIDTFQLYTDIGREFPRPPFAMEFEYNDEFFVVINNHLKCCGDGVLQSWDSWDEETRRLHASNLLESFVNSNYPDANVIVLGDLNDEITDSPDNNVFVAFTEEADSYMFVDMDIAEGESDDWSYPNWPSQIDHILVSDELFDEIDSDAAEVSTIRIGDYLEGGYDEYDDNVSDHRPVAMKVEVNSGVVSTGDLARGIINLYNYPNPFKQFTTITFDPVFEPARLDIYSAASQKVRSYAIGNNQGSVQLDATDLPVGVYYATLVVGLELKAVARIIHMN